MNQYIVKLRFFPEDPLDDIREEDLKSLEKAYRVAISYEKIENRVLENNLLVENTMDKHIEDISQEVVTVSSDSDQDFQACIKALYKKYRCPRTSYGLLGSNEAGQKIAKALMDVYGGW
jgi:cytochrome oxidase Cu insertion factor (SCO1/SenC/PrrC family)